MKRTDAVKKERRIDFCVFSASVPARSAEKIANAIRSNGNSDVMVRIIPGVSHSLLPDPVGPNSGWVYLPAFATSPQLLDVMTNWAATHLLASSRNGMQH